MKKSFIKIIAGIFCAGMLVACEADLDFKPETQVSDPSFWNTARDFELYANNFYLDLPGLPAGRDADTAFGNSNNNVSSGTNLAPENDGNWGNAYARIRKATYLVEKAEEKADLDVKRYVAEAKFFRAYWYYNLVRLFGDVPLVTKVLSTGSEELYLPRTTRTDVIDFALQDLEYAVANLPERSDLKASELGRVTKGAANALMAKVALFEGTWSKYHGGAKTDERLNVAKSAAATVINSGEYALYNSSGDESFRRLFLAEGDDNSLGKKTESIFHRRYWEEVSTHGYSNSNQANFSATRKMVDMFLCADGLPIDKSPMFKGYGTFTSEFEDRDPRCSQSIVKVGDETWTHQGSYVYQAEPQLFYWGKTGYRVWKMQGEGQPRMDYKEFNDHHIIRYAEVLLIYAEATYELAGTISDADLDKSINVLRDRVGMPHLTNGFVQTNGLDMLTEIRRERTVELAFEGERLEDLKRWKTAVDELSKPIAGIQYENSEWKGIIPFADLAADGIDANGFVIFQQASERKFSDKNYLFPVPTQQIQLNPELTQNPGW
ncbi:hypothetical protein FUAX_06560 [Fulvitalea axinellae]|uniref:RagB/SusD family nutrient uptake outer membrane protein n=1 Tax=Fulvitalea axinellae TaxID=1182444 RepID=A0AAU9D1B8_9BACT|nr:hypothetical protein FUAX_06560 [Fulvitalea axinellae]